MKPDRTNKAALVADVLCRRFYGVPLKNSGGKLPMLMRDGFAIVKALERLEAKGVK